MADPIRIRAQALAGKVVVRALFSHPMESGRRLDAQGQPIPAHYIETVQATLNGTPLFTADWGPWVSRNPILRFQVPGARPGDIIGLSWTDNRGQARSDQAVVV